MSVRKFVLAGLATCLAVPLAAGPVLTTIQDMVYNANGTPYNGFAVINWTPSWPATLPRSPHNR